MCHSVIPPLHVQNSVGSCRICRYSHTLTHTHTRTRTHTHTHTHTHAPEVLAQVRPPTATQAGTRGSSTVRQGCIFLSFSSWRLRRPLGALDPCGPPSLILFYPPPPPHTHTQEHTARHTPEHAARYCDVCGEVAVTQSMITSHTSWSQCVLHCYITAPIALWCGWAWRLNQVKI